MTPQTRKRKRKGGRGKEERRQFLPPVSFSLSDGKREEEKREGGGAKERKNKFKVFHSVPSVPLFFPFWSLPPACAMRITFPPPPTDFF